MNKRVNIMLPETTLKVLDRVAGKGDRSRFISEAVLYYVHSRSASNLRGRLKQGALANATLNLEIAEEWFPVEQEAWQKLDKEERIRKTSRGGAKSTSRRSTRR
jgi:CopG family transcriptional regulator/antitoxin EndoAI